MPRGGIAGAGDASLFQILPSHRVSFLLSPLPVLSLLRSFGGFLLLDSYFFTRDHAPCACVRLLTKPQSDQSKTRPAVHLTGRTPSLPSFPPSYWCPDARTIFTVHG